MTSRLHYIDWLRVLAFMTLIIFHCAVPFVEHYNWEINSEDTSPWITRIIWWTHQWRLPLLFFIAGVGVRFSLKRRSILTFFGERCVRLFIPLVFAIFCITPIQVYFEWLQKGRVTSSYWEFYPQVFEIVPYPEGAFTWSHMWFVAYLFVFTIIMLPLFATAKVAWFKRLKQPLNFIFKSPVAHILLAIPFIVYIYVLFLDWPEQGSLIDDWYVFIMSITFYLFGFLLSGIDNFWKSCERYRGWFLLIALLTASHLFVNYFWNYHEMKPTTSGKEFYVYALLNGTHIWAIILTTIGYAMRYLNFGSRRLTYLNQAIYPFYIMHQAVIVASGYYILQWNIGILFKLLSLIVICVASIWLCYHLIIRHTILTRVLFGMKWNQKVRR